MSQNIGGQRPTNRARRSAFPRSSSPIVLARIHFLGLRFNVGVRIGEVYEHPEELDGREAYVFGWSYQTLEAHFEQGQMHYEVWKWLDTGEVEFRLHAFPGSPTTAPF